MRNFIAAAMLGIVCAVGGWFASDAGQANAARPPLEGTMGKFQPADQPRPVPDLGFIGPSGAQASLSDFKGKIVLLNLWATWCAPCVKEMPSLDALQARLGGEDFQVVALSLDRGGRNVVQPFFERLGIRNLEMYLDPPSAAMGTLKPRGLPTTLVIDRDGFELGRLEGEADWNSEEAVRMLRHFIDDGVRPTRMMKTSG
ncbi:TlpA family protein disulfide reductase [Skermanella stibiiresistens]|nr:TlpA disulfide reductase family protein [Skermanella stibiiresistens]